MSHLEREIFEQPEILQALVAEPDVKGVADELRRLDPSLLVTIARGSSDNAVGFFSYLAGRRLGLAAASLPPSLFTLFDSRLRLPRSTVAVAVSQSGRSEDVRLALSSVVRDGATAVAVTNDAGSPLALEASHHLSLGAGTERAVAATKTFTAQLLKLSLLVAHWARDEELLAALEAVPGAMRGLLANREPVAEAALRLTHAEEMWVLGRGPAFAVAQEVALKLKETSYLATQAYSTAEFLHGPIAALAPRTPVLLLAGNDGTLASSREAVARLQELQVDLTVVSSVPDLLGAGKASVPLPGGLHPLTEAFLMVLVGQLLALHLTVARGFDPDSPRNISKVTRTI